VLPAPYETGSDIIDLVDAQTNAKVTMASPRTLPMKGCEAVVPDQHATVSADIQP
jgi:hypothetical protein